MTLEHPMANRPVLVTGATGYVGGRLVPLLLSAGYRVRATARDPGRLRHLPWARHPRIELAAMDATDPSDVHGAVAGCGAVFYLIHSMIASKEGFADADRIAAEAMAEAAAAAGAERIIYLGGLGDANHPELSRHLRSRHEVEDIFRAGPVPATCLRAAMILGSGSASFEMLRYLVERLPVMITPRWVSTPCQPISIANVLGYLKGCLEVPETAGGIFDIGGPEVVSYRELIRIYAQEAGLMPRLIFPVPVLTPKLSSLWIHLVTPVPAVIARPLAEGLSIPVVCREDRIRALVPQRLEGCRETIQSALDRIRQAETDVCALPAEHPQPPEWAYCGDPAYTGGTTFSLRLGAELAADIDTVWARVAAIGGRDGYYHGRLLWRIRGWIDRLAGGPGLRKERNDTGVPALGDTFHFWRVAAVDPPRRLVLESLMKAPGDALMELHLEATGRGTALALRSVFLPRGLPGLIYWYVLLPAHRWVFSGLLRGIAAHCRAAVLKGPAPWPTDRRAATR